MSELNDGDNIPASPGGELKRYTTVQKIDGSSSTLKRSDGNYAPFFAGSQDDMTAEVITGSNSAGLAAASRVPYEPLSLTLLELGGTKDVRLDGFLTARLFHQWNEQLYYTSTGQPVPPVPSLNTYATTDYYPFMPTPALAVGKVKISGITTLVTSTPKRAGGADFYPVQKGNAPINILTTAQKTNFPEIAAATYSVNNLSVKFTSSGAGWIIEPGTLTYTDSQGLIVPITYNYTSSQDYFQIHPSFIQSGPKLAGYRHRFTGVIPYVVAPLPIRPQGVTPPNSSFFTVPLPGTMTMARFSPNATVYLDVLIAP